MMQNHRQKNPKKTMIPKHLADKMFVNSQKVKEDTSTRRSAYFAGQGQGTNKRWRKRNNTEAAPSSRNTRNDLSMSDRSYSNQNNF